jgi:hypothetical protein
MTRKIPSLNWRSFAMVNPIAGAIYDTKHWLNLWGTPQRKIHENIQISRALQAIRLSKDPKKFLATSKQQFFYTTYSSSSSATLKTRIDWKRVNVILSQYWMLGKLEMPSGTQDWSEKDIERIIQIELGPECASEYRIWSDRFKGMHLVSRE